MESIRAKFKCDSITQWNNESKTAYLSAVYGESEENKSFAKYTPSAQLVITISNETPANEFFERGKEYYLDFTKTN